MWKNIVILAVVIGAISLTACKSDYRCSCPIGSVTVDTLYRDVTKREAKAKCEEVQNDINTLFPSVTCEVSKAK